MSSAEDLTLSFKRIEKRVAQLKLSPSEVSKLADVSVNTVKAVLGQSGGSPITLLKLERALDQEERRRAATLLHPDSEPEFPEDFDKQCALSISMAKSLSSLVAKMVNSAPAKSPALTQEELLALRRPIKSILANLALLQDG